jgi:hypothetical protein
MPNSAFEIDSSYFMLKSQTPPDHGIQMADKVVVWLFRVGQHSSITSMYLPQHKDKDTYREQNRICNSTSQE